MGRPLGQASILRQLLVGRVKGTDAERERVAFGIVLLTLGGAQAVIAAGNDSRLGDKFEEAAAETLKQILEPASN